MEKLSCNTLDIRQFIIFINNKKKYKIATACNQAIQLWRNKLTTSRTNAPKWLKDKPKPPAIALETQGTLSANPNDNVEHMREVWSIVLDKIRQ